MCPKENHHLSGRFRKYAAPGPYPEIKVLKPNRAYAEILMDDYAGVISEFTAINQYLYHHYFFDIIDNQLADLLEGVAVIEMYHLEILAELIILLGGDPRIRGGESTKGKYWNGSFIGYGKTLCEQLDLDIRAEVEAIKNYEIHIQQIADPHIQAILRRIIKDEEHHIVLFEEQKRRFKCR
ncbi:ferritin-like domain-containing protein [Tepidibacillus sp. LV47]|uniref:ferritin-like domain-containing protein n=1 Tax=Tepidibacillus sp. LV47 TaxID=3398228 RepID=UPI003AB03275